MIMAMAFFNIQHVSDDKGRGAVAKKNLKAGTVLDVAQIIFVTDEEYDQLANTCVYNYLFEWQIDGEPLKYVLALSPCEFINHSYSPNSKYEMDYDNNTIIFKTIKDIKKGEELTVNYNGDVNNNDPLWFEVKN